MTALIDQSFRVKVLLTEMMDTEEPSPTAAPSPPSLRFTPAERNRHFLPKTPSRFSIRTSLKTPSSACFVPGGRPLSSVFVSARSEAAGRRRASRGEPLSVTDQPAVPRWQEPPSPPGRSTSPTWITSRSVAGCGAEEDNLWPERPSNSSPEIPSQRRVEVLTLKEESN